MSDLNSDTLKAAKILRTVCYLWSWKHLGLLLAGRITVLAFQRRSDREEKKGVEDKTPDKLQRC